MRYDPNTPPDGEQWSDLNEAERMDCVIDYHRRARIKLPNARLHAVMHVIVENQILLGDETPVASTLARLMAEGLDRHDALHAIASVLSGAIFDAIKSPGGGDLSASYFREVSQLTADKWRSQAD
jgi:Domain of unknown function (DUF1841)